MNGGPGDAPPPAHAAEAILDRLGALASDDRARLVRAMARLIRADRERERRLLALRRME